MRKVNIARVSEPEQADNMIILKEFYHAFSSGILSSVGDYMHDDGLYFGKWNKGRALGYLHQLIHKGSSLTYCEYIYFNLGFSNDFYIGEQVIEIRFVPDYPWDDERYFRAGFGNPVNTAYKEIVYRFSVTFKDLKIYSLRHPKKIISSIKHYVDCN
jgi:hypothetical protein